MNRERRVRTICAAAALLALAATPRAAEAITLQSDLRMVAATMQQCFFPPPPDPPQCSILGDQRTPSPAFSPFNQTVGFFGQASENTVVSTTAMSGTGAVGATFDENTFSSFAVRFAATGAEGFAFTAEFTSLGSGYVYGQLRDLTASSDVFLTNQAGAFNSSGTLVAGHQYELTVNVSASAGAFGGGTGGSASYNFGFTLATPTPVPAFPYADGPEGPAH